jgi:hypothetical protein
VGARLEVERDGPVKMIKQAISKSTAMAGGDQVASTLRLNISAVFVQEEKARVILIIERAGM